MRITHIIQCLVEPTGFRPAMSLDEIGNILIIFHIIKCLNFTEPTVQQWWSFLLPFNIIIINNLVDIACGAFKYKITVVWMAFDKLNLSVEHVQYFVFLYLKYSCTSCA